MKGEIAVSKVDVKKEFNLNDSSFYQRMRLDSEEILKFKEKQKAKAGADLSYDRALIDWLITRSSRVKRKK